MTCTTRCPVPCRATPARSCSRQPGFAVAMISAPVACARRHLAIEYGRRHLRVRDVVDAGRPAAEIGKRHFAKDKPRNRTQDLARSTADLLSVREMARVLVSHRSVHATHVGVRSGRGDELRYVFHQSGKTLRPGAYSGSCSSNSPYSFSVDPHPAAFVMIASYPPSRIASMLRFASARASSRIPEWT